MRTRRGRIANLIVWTAAASLFQGGWVRGAVYFVDGEAAVNGVGSEEDPFNTMEAAFASVVGGDVVRVAGAIRDPHLVADLKGRPNIVIEQWLGRAQADIRGDRVIPASDWVANDNGVTYFAAVPEAPASVVWNWDSNIDALGRHFGHLHPTASLDDCAMMDGSWYMDDVNGYVHVNPPDQAAPPNLGDTYAWCRTQNGWTIETAIGLKIRGLMFSLFPDNRPANGYAADINSASDCEVRDVVTRDCGFHSLGYTGATGSGNRFVNVTCWGLRGAESPGNHLVFFTSQGNLAGSAGVNCTAHLYTLLGPDGLASEPELLRCDGFYSHTSLTGRIADLVWKNCRVVGYAGFGGFAYGAGSASTLAATEDDWRTYPVRVIDSVAENCNFISVNAAHVAFVRCGLDLTRMSEANIASTGINTASSAQVSARLLLEACTVAGNSDFVNRGRIIHADPLTKVTMIASTIYDDGVTAATRSLLRAADIGSVFDARQCVFMFRVMGPANRNKLLFGAVLPPSNMRFTGCWYSNIEPTLGYSQNTAYDSRSEWMTLDPEPAAVYDVDPQFNGAPLDLSPAPGGALAVTRWVEPMRRLLGINLRGYDGHYGAYQYGPKFSATR